VIGDFEEQGRVVNAGDNGIKGIAKVFLHIGYFQPLMHITFCHDRRSFAGGEKLPGFFERWLARFRVFFPIRLLQQAEEDAMDDEIRVPAYR